MDYAGTGFSAYNRDTGTWNDSTGYAVTHTDCTKINCGIVPGRAEHYFICAQMNDVGTYACDDPRCKAYKSMMTQCGRGAGGVVIPRPPPAVVKNPSSVQILTAQTLIVPTPSIVPTAAPVPAMPQESLWCRVNEWINDNPLLAAGALVGLYFVLVPKK